MFFWHDRRESPSGSLERCFTDSLDGVSEAPFSALNLGLHVGDDERAVRVNRERVSAQLGGVPIAWMDQVHGASVAEVTLADVASGQAGPSADAMVSRDSGLALGVTVGLAAAVFCATRPRTLATRAIEAIALILYSMPVYLFAFGLLLVFSVLCFAMYAGSGDVTWRRRGIVVLKWTLIAAAGFFAVLIAERLVELL